jgi:hypothetical protein
MARGLALTHLYKRLTACDAELLYYGVKFPQITDNLPLNLDYECVQASEV